MAIVDKRHDVFISYAHKDNPPPEKPITQLVDLLKETYRTCYNGEEIDVFFDEDGLKPGDLWENKLLESLRQSAVMIVILSGEYYNSEYCYKEWRNFQDVEIHYSLPGTGIIANKYRNDKKPEVTTPSVNIWIQEWIDDLGKRQYYDISDWQANRDTQTFKQLLVAVCEQIYDRKRRLEERKKIPSNVRPHNANFTGRAQQIRDVHEALTQSSIGVITAIKGIGGIGKSTIAYEYAHAYIDYYQGGTFNFNAEGCEDFRIALASIAAVSGITFNEEEQKNLDLQCQRVWYHLCQSPPALLILDNVDKDAILNRIADYAPDRHKLHILVTSRQGFVTGKSIKEFHTPPLGQNFSLDLLLKLFKAKDEDEWKAANSIILRLGGHPLAITMIGTFLANNGDATYTEQLQWLEAEGIGSLDKISEEIRLDDYAHPVPTKVFEQVFSLLEPEGKATAGIRVLEYAALLPPDSVPLPWIFELVKEEFPEIAPNQKKLIDPWKKLLQQLERFQLLLPSVEEPKIGTMHRLIQDAIRQRHNRSLYKKSRFHILNWIHDTFRHRHDRNRQYCERLILHIDSRTDFLIKNLSRGNIPPECLWKIKLQPLNGMLDHVDFTLWAQDIAFFEQVLGRMLIQTGSLTEANKHFRESLELRRQHAGKDPNNADLQQTLYFSMNESGDSLFIGGDLSGALKHYEESLEIMRRLAGKDPGNADWQRELALSLDRIGYALKASGDLPGALKHCEETLKIGRRLAREDPGNTRLQRDIAMYLHKVGSVLYASGDLPGALKHYEESLEIGRQIAGRDPSNADWQEILSQSLNNVGNVLIVSGDQPGARKCYEESLEIMRRLAEKAPNNAGWQGGFAESLGNVGYALKAGGDLPGAQKCYEESLEIMRRLAGKDPSNAEWQNGLALFLNGVGDVLNVGGDMPGAQKHYKESLEIWWRLAGKDPGNAVWQESLAGSLDRIGGVLKASSDLPGALKHYEESLEIMRRLAGKDPGNVGWQWGLAASLDKVGDVLEAMGDLPRAQKCYEESQEIKRRLDENQQ